MTPVALADCDPARLALLDDLTRVDHPARVDRVVVEGAESVRWLVRSPLALELVLGKPSMLEALAADLAARDDAPLVVAAEPAAISRVVGFRFTRGVVACARRPAPRDVADLVAQRPRCLALLDAVHDPGNVGGLVRSARCLGLDALILGPGCADPFYRRAVRVSVGHVCHLPLARCTDSAAAVAALRAAGIRCLAAHRGPLSRPLSALEPATGPWCLVLGNEDRGPPPETVAACDGSIFIEMAPEVDSLGVAAAGAVLMHALREGGS